MATPLGTTFVTDERTVVQDDVLRKGKMVESLVVEFDQAKYEEFLSSGSKSPLLWLQEPKGPRLSQGLGGEWPRSPT